MAKTKPSTENKLLAGHVAAAFGGRPEVAEYRHDILPLTIDLLWCNERPCEGVTSYSTIRLSDYSLRTETGTEFPARLELVAVCRTAFDKFANILAAAAFCIIRNRVVYPPGSVFRDYVREYYVTSTVPHLYVTAPYPWEGTLASFNCGTKNVSWLLIVPISESEYIYLNKNGDVALEALLEKNQVNIFDLYRKSVI